MVASSGQTIKSDLSSRRDLTLMKGFWKAHMKLLDQSITVAQSDDERRAIYEFRYRIYIEEMGKPYSHADHALKQFRDELDDRATLLYSTRDGEITGTLRINWGEDDAAFTTFTQSCALANFGQFPADSLSFCSRLMVHQARRSSAVAAALSTTAYLMGRARDTQFNFMHCAPRLVRLFERMGFRQYTRPFRDPEIGSQVPLVLVLEDVDHLRATRSPFLDQALKRINTNYATRWFHQQFPVMQPDQISEEIRTNHEFDRLRITHTTVQTNCRTSDRSFPRKPGLPIGGPGGIRTDGLSQGPADDLSSGT